MRIRPILFLLLCATGAAAQIPTLTNAATIKFAQGNTIFSRSVADVLALVGAENIAVTGNWTFSSNLTQLKDAGTYFYDDSDITKLMRFQLSGITTGTTRNLTVPNSDGTLALTLAAYGGTGQSAVAQGDLLYGSSADTWSRLAKSSTATRYLANTGVGNSPAWAQIDMTNGVTGTLPVANGGTGIATLSANRIPYGNGTSAFQSSANLTFDGTTLAITGRGTYTTTATYGSGNNRGLYVAGTMTSNANNSNVNSIQSTVTFANSGAETGNSFRGAYIENTTADPTSGSNIGLQFTATNSSPNVAALYGTLGSIVENSASGDLSTRYGLLGRADKGVNNNTTHTAVGVFGQLREQSSSGRWKIGYGVQSEVNNAQTAYGLYLTTSTSRGTTNTATGLHIINNVSGLGVVIDNAYGINLNSSASSSGVITNYYGIIQSSVPSGATNAYFLYGNTSTARSYLAGGLAIGVTPGSTDRLTVRGSGATSGTNTALFENSSGTDIFIVRDDQMSAFGTTPVSSERLTVRGSTSDNTAKAFVAERSSGTDVLGVQNDGKVSINNAAYTEELTVNGQAQLDGVILTNVTGSTTASGHVVYTDDATYGGYLTVGDGDRQLAIMPTMIERHVLDYAVNWTTGRKGAFWTVPARFNGWKISKAYISVTAIGSGAGDDELTIEIGGVGANVQIITAGTHTLVMDEPIATDDVITFNITTISATPAQGLHVSLELSKN